MKHFLFIFICSLFLITHPVQAKSENLEKYIQETINLASTGADEWQIAPFGKMRLVSERIGVKGINGLILGIEVELDQDWSLNQPQIKVHANTEALIYPTLHIKKKVKTDWENNFTGQLLFPFLLRGPFDENIDIHVQADWAACHPDQGCQNQQTHHQLFLPYQEANASLWYGSLNEHLKQLAFPAEKSGIQAQAHLSNNQLLQIQLIFPKKISAVEIQGKNIREVLNTRIRKNTFEGTLILKNPITLDEKISVLLRTSIGCYTLNLAVGDMPLEPIPLPLSLWSSFWIGIFFFLLSPAWSYWLNPTMISKTPKTFRQEIRKLQLLLFGGILAFYVLWNMGTILSEFYNSPLIQLISLGLLIYLMITPLPNRYIIPLLLIVLPKPFLNTIMVTDPMSKLWLLIWLGICFYLPFNLWIIGQKHVLSFFKQTQRELSYQICVRLPYIILFVWIVFSLQGLLK